MAKDNTLEEITTRIKTFKKQLRQLEKDSQSLWDQKKTLERNLSNAESEREGYIYQHYLREEDESNPNR
jgi:predicted  nucleic acid-binding Zn-ribbon protein